MWQGRSSASKHHPQSRSFIWFIFVLACLFISQVSITATWMPYHTCRRRDSVSWFPKQLPGPIPRRPLEAVNKAGGIQLNCSFHSALPHSNHPWLCSIFHQYWGSCHLANVRQLSGLSEEAGPLELPLCPHSGYQQVEVICFLPNQSILGCIFRCTGRKEMRRSALLAEILLWVDIFCRIQASMWNI